jgi:aminoglycoside 3-N-acetyltransferase
MVHSSLSSLGYVPGGAETVIKALLAALGPEGTLVMPTHSWDRSGRDFRFDVRHTPSCVGTISEVFRTMRGVARSMHPTHSVAAIGPSAAYLTEGHENALTPCGEGTPYGKLIEERCQILFLGTTLDQNTMFHALEALAKLPYLMRDEDEAFTMTDSAGTTRVMQIRRHNRGPNRRFAATQGFLEAQGIVRKGSVGASDSLLVESAPMATLVLDTLRSNPDFLLE